MAEDVTPDVALELFDLDLPLSSLAALGAVPGLACGPLSPLLRVPQPPVPPDVAGMQELLGRAQALAPWLLPTLLDPHLSVGFIVGDQDAPVSRQYAWPDPAGAGPGLELTVEPAALHVAGPVDMPELRQQFAALLRLSDLPESPVVAMTLTAAEAWALAALTDAYRMTLAARRASRQGGLPGGVLVADVLAAWHLGLQEPNPGWAVTMLSLLAPEAVPGDFEETLRATLESLDDAELIFLVDADVTGGEGDTIIFGEGLRLLVAGLAGPLFLFGLCAQRLAPTGDAEVTVAGGWRTPEAVWLLDLSALRENRADLLLASREYMTDLIADLLPGEPDASFALDTPYGAEALLAGLAAIATAPSRPQARFCHKCGAAVQPGWKFCAICKTPVHGVGGG